jgi:regulator of protease activity HflC (stomatin/prohibitin superfamily)
MGSVSAFLGLLSLLGFLIFLGGVGLVVLSASQGRPVRRGIGLAAAGLVLGLVFTVVSQGILTVSPTEVAVVYNTLNGNLETPRRPGTSIVIPAIQAYQVYDITQQSYTMSGAENEGARSGDDAVRARTEDGQEISMDISLLYGVDPNNVNTLYTRWRDRYQDDFVRPTARGIVRDVVSGFRAEEIYGEQRTEMETSMQQQIADRMSAEGLVLTDLLVRDITFSEAFANAVEQAQVAEQEAARARLQVEQRRQEADQARAVAQGQRDAAIARAEGEAQSIILRAQAEAESLRLVSEQIAANPLLIQYQYVQTLSDNIRLALVPADSPFLFDFSSIQGSSDFTAPIVPESSLDVTTEEATPEPGN